MIKHSVATLTLASAVLFSTGCSMLPYRDNFQCEKGKNSGVCASVSDVYEMSYDIEDMKKRKLNPDGCDGDCEEVKSQDVTGAALNSNPYELENQKLKEIVEAMEIKKLQSGRPIIIQGDTTQNDSDVNPLDDMRVEEIDSSNADVSQTNSGGMAQVDCSKFVNDNNIHVINSDVKVCVWRANIRKEPSCKAKVLRVAKKGDVMFADYEKNGWVKLNDGYIHKSIITAK